MKIACIITAYKDPNQLKRTITKLGKMDFYVHVDAKVDIAPFKRILSGCTVHYVEDRVFVGWGGYSQVESLKRLIRDVLDSCKEYDRVLCISGQDYPVYSYKRIEKFFEDYPQKNFLTSLNISEYKNVHSLQKIQRYWFYDIRIKNTLIMKSVRKLLYFCAGAGYYLGALKKDNHLYVNDTRWDVFFGSDYWCLTYDCAKYVYASLSNKSIENYFKHSFAPSELIIHTIVQNSEYKGTCEIILAKDYSFQKVTPLQYVNYLSTGMKVLDENDYKVVIESGRLFCRKVETGISDKLEDMLDANMIYSGLS